MGAAEAGLAASCGYAVLPVFGMPTVAILATGDELVEVVFAFLVTEALLALAIALWSVVGFNTAML